MANKTKVKISGVQDIEKSFRKVVRAGVDNGQTMTEIGSVIQKSIVGSARSGKDPNGNKFAPLSKSWVSRKAKLSNVNNPSEFYRKTRSNITFTGQLLDSFTFEIKKAQLLLRFFFKGNRKPYVGIRKPQLDGVSTNAELAEEIEKDRPFVMLGDKTKDVVINLVKRKIRQQLNNFKRLSKILR